MITAHHIGMANPASRVGLDVSSGWIAMAERAEIVARVRFRPVDGIVIADDNGVFIGVLVTAGVFGEGEVSMAVRIGTGPAGVIPGGIQATVTICQAAKKHFGLVRCVINMARSPHGSWYQVTIVAFQSRPDGTNRA